VLNEFDVRKKPTTFEFVGVYPTSVGASYSTYSFGGESKQISLRPI
jgi:hypothetical protein